MEQATRHLYLARHAEPDDTGLALSARGREQARLLGRRLAGTGLRAIEHGPLPRAVETARLVAEQVGADVLCAPVAAAGDYVPHLPRRDEVGPTGWAAVEAHVGDVSELEACEGAGLGAAALGRFVGPVDGPEEVRQLVVTHAFTIGWLVRHALDAPPWRWWGLDTCHAGLTVLRYVPGRPPTVVVLNDVSHLPEELRWTGFPAHLRP